MAWQLLSQNEQHRLLAYVEKTKAWEAVPPLDAACYNISKQRKVERLSRLSMAG